MELQRCYRVNKQCHCIIIIIMIIIIIIIIMHHYVITIKPANDRDH
jgi:hypothetical protein